MGTECLHKIETLDPLSKSCPLKQAHKHTSNMEYSSNDISAYFQHCPECDIQWRSHHLRPCENCDAAGIVLVLEVQQIEVLMKAVNAQFYGVNDETDLMTILANLMRDQWPDVPAALLAQACWMHLRGDILSPHPSPEKIEIAKEYSGDVPCASQTHPSPEDIEIAKEYFEERFQDSLQEYLDEYQWEAHKAVPQGLRAL